MNIVIFEDYDDLADALKQNINKITQEDNQIVVYSNVITNIKELKDTEIIFMDIELHDQSGIELAKKIEQQYPGKLFIFMSSYPVYSQEIFECKPLFFLLKPIKEKYLRDALKKARDILRPAENITVSNGGVPVKINISDIKYIESEKRKVNIYTVRKVITVYEKLNILEKILPEYFCRCHQSYLVNLNYVMFKNTREFILKDKKKIPISQRKLVESRNNFINFMED